jgi:hypothetical protein
MTESGLRSDLPRALRVVWLILALVGGLAVVAPFLVPASLLFNIFPICSAKAAGSSCILCGMTTAFVSIGEGDIAAAQSANAAALPLYCLMIMNFAVAAAYTIRVKRHASS